MSANNLIDVDSLRVYLQAELPQAGRLLEAEKFADGQSNPTFALTTDRGRFVLRRKPPGELLKSAHAVDREYRVQKALADSDVPVAGMYRGIIPFVIADIFVVAVLVAFPILSTFIPNQLM